MRKPVFPQTITEAAKRHAEKASVDWSKPLPELEGTFPVVLYFGSEVDRKEFIKMVRLAKPGLKAVPLPNG